MSTTYQPTYPRGLPPEAASWLDEELRAIKKAMESAKPYETLQVLNKALPKTVAGMVVLCDGTNLDLGSGAGAYRRNAANSAWVFLG